MGASLKAKAIAALAVIGSCTAVSFAIEYGFKHSEKYQPNKESEQAMRYLPMRAKLIEPLQTIGENGFFSRTDLIKAQSALTIAGLRLCETQHILDEVYTNPINKRYSELITRLRDTHDMLLDREQRGPQPIVTDMVSDLNEVFRRYNEGEMTKEETDASINGLEQDLNSLKRLGQLDLSKTNLDEIVHAAAKDIHQTLTSPENTEKAYTLMDASRNMGAGTLGILITFLTVFPLGAGIASYCLRKKDQKIEARPLTSF